MSGTGNLSAVIPAPVSPIADVATGNVTIPWRAYFLVLQRRTGGDAGASTGDTAKLVETERNARIAADQALQIAVDAEIAARAAADAVETAARIAGDQYLNTVISGTANQLQAEIARATSADALLVPIASLCSMWAACDLSFLPVTDPGGGKPWLDGGHIAINPVVAVVGIGLEDGAGAWGLEAGVDNWLWG